jgi:hypothetical protein
MNEQLHQPWYSGVAVNLSYVTLVSKVDRSTAAQNLFTSLGCGSIPINPSSRQQDLILTGVQQSQPTYAYPMFSFSRSDATHTCQLSDQNATFGPYQPTASDYTFNSSIKSSTSDTLHLEDLYSAVNPVLSAFNIVSTPTIGGVTAVSASAALTQFEAYVNRNLQLTLLNNATLLDFGVNDIRNGTLVYGARLTIHKITNGNEEVIPVGTLQIFVKTKLSLFTDKTVNAPVPNLGTNILPDYSFIHPWTANIIPVGQTTPQQLSAGIDLNDPNAANHVLPKLNALTASSTPDQIHAVCQALKSRLGVLNFNQEDILAVTADALLSAPGANTGANYTQSRSTCFTADERVLMRYMNVPSGNDDPIFTRTS